MALLVIKYKLTTILSAVPAATFISVEYVSEKTDWSEINKFFIENPTHIVLVIDSNYISSVISMTNLLSLKLGDSISPYHYLLLNIFCGDDAMNSISNKSNEDNVFSVSIVLPNYIYTVSSPFSYREAMYRMKAFFLLGKHSTITVPETSNKIISIIKRN